MLDEITDRLIIPIAAENDKQKHGRVSRHQLKQTLHHYLSIIDVRHYLLLIQNSLSFDQVRARLDSLHYDVHYKVIDDFRPPILPEAIFNAAFDEVDHFAQIQGQRGGKDASIEIDEILKPRE